MPTCSGVSSTGPLGAQKFAPDESRKVVHRDDVLWAVMLELVARVADELQRHHPDDDAIRLVQEVSDQLVVTLTRLRDRPVGRPPA